jgi:hypothetical protein
MRSRYQLACGVTLTSITRSPHWERFPEDSRLYRFPLVPVNTNFALLGSFDILSPDYICHHPAVWALGGALQIHDGLFALEFSSGPQSRGIANSGVKVEFQADWQPERR